MYKRIGMLVCAVMLAASTVTAGYPTVVSGVPAKNQWTSSISGGFAAAQSYNLPVLIAFVNHPACGQCQKWLNNCLISGFYEWLDNHPCVLIFYDQPQHSDYTAMFRKYIYSGASYPGIAMYNANGSLISRMQGNQYGMNYNFCYSYFGGFQNWLSRAYPQHSRISLDPQSLTVSEGTNATIYVMRESRFGNVTANLSARKGTISPSSYTWQGTEGRQSFTYTPVVSEEYDGVYTTKVSMAVENVTVTTEVPDDPTVTVIVKDRIIGLTLDEFVLVRTNLTGLVASAGDWFVDTNGLLRSSPVDVGGTNTLSFTPTLPGRITFTARMPEEACQFTVALGGSETNASEIGVKGIGVSAGQTVTWTGISGTNDAVFALESFTFTPFEQASLLSPAEGSIFQLRDLNAGKMNEVDLFWTKIPEAESYEVRADSNGGVVYFPVVGNTNCNAIAVGIVETDLPQGEITVRVTSYVPASQFDMGEVTIEGAQRRFSVVDRAIYNMCTPDTFTSYTRLDTTLDASATYTEALSNITYRAVGLPYGFSINPNTGIITGTAKNKGTYDISVFATVKDENGNVIGDAARKDYTLALNDVKILKRKLAGMILSSEGIEGTVEGSISTTGKYSIKLILENKVAITGNLSVDGDGRVMLSGKGLTLSCWDDGVWTGDYNGCTVVANDILSSKAYAGTYTGVLLNTPQYAGYATMKLSTTGKFNVKFILPDTKSSTGQIPSFVLNADQAARAGIRIPGGQSEAVFFPIYRNGRLEKVFGVGIVLPDRTITSWNNISWFNTSVGSSLFFSGSQIVKSFSSFEGKKLTIYKNGEVIDEYTLNGAFNYTDAPANVKSKGTTSSNVIAPGLLDIDTGRRITLKGVAAPGSGVAVALKKSGNFIYYGVVEFPLDW